MPLLRDLEFRIGELERQLGELYYKFYALKSKIENPPVKNENVAAEGLINKPAHYCENEKRPTFQRKNI